MLILYHRGKISKLNDIECGIHVKLKSVLSFDYYTFSIQPMCYYYKKIAIVEHVESQKLLCRFFDNNKIVLSMYDVKFLNKVYQNDIEEFSENYEFSDCLCSVTPYPPCSWCTHPGNWHGYFQALIEDEDAWYELEYDFFGKEITI